MNLKNNKGFTGVDISVAMLIILTLIPTIFAIIYSIQKTSVFTERKAESVKIATDIIEIAKSMNNLENIDSLYNELINNNNYFTSTYTIDGQTGDNYRYLFKIGNKNVNYQVQIYLESYYPNNVELENRKELVKQLKVTVIFPQGKITSSSSISAVIVSKDTTPEQVHFANVEYENNQQNNQEEYVNAPELKTGMIPITYESATDKWVVADVSNQNKNWYDYSNKKWANICTVSNSNSGYRTAEIGTEIPMNAMTTMFVWIPRYAYSVKSGFQTSNTDSPSTTNSGENKIDIKFLVGNTNTDENNITYATDYNIETDIVNGKTPMIVHPGFKYGDNQLSGIWIAKFESSGTNSSGVEVGNKPQNGSIVETDTSTFIKILPNKISWRHITIGETEYQCTQMSSNSTAYGWSNVNTHLIKNSEWGTVSYLCYSKYGNVPMINGCGNISGSTYYDLYTGMGPKSSTEEYHYDATSKSGHEYNTENGVLSSTTGNVYGIYDMSGGAWERVAGYLDNKVSDLDYFGRSSSIRYFPGNVLDSSYSALWERYQVSDEEKNDSIAVVGESQNLSKSQLWNKAEGGEYNVARKRITDITYNNMKNIKGIGLGEISNTHSYKGRDSSGNYKWFINATDTTANYGKTWNDDDVLIGHGSSVFMVKSGCIDYGIVGGVLMTEFTGGGAYSNLGFHVAICP